MILFDLNYFKYCFLKATGLEFNEVKLQDDFERLKTDLMQDMGDTFMYRDFQARNVMMKDGEPYFIDFREDGAARSTMMWHLSSGRPAHVTRRTSARKWFRPTFAL